MDKQTLSHYGWIVVMILCLSVMMALATPLGHFVGDGVVSVANGFVSSANNATDDNNISKMEHSWEQKLNGKENVITKPDDIKNWYDVKYYSSLNLAITDVNNDTIGENADTTKENAVAGVYVENDDIITVLFKDITEQGIKVSRTQTINLGGHTFTSVMTGTNIAINVTGSGTLLNVDGRISGSKINISAVATSAIFQCATGGNYLNINGGEYTVDCTTGNSTYIIYAANGSNINAKNCTMNINNSGGLGIGAYVFNNCILDNCTINTVVTTSQGFGVYNSNGNVVIKDCKISQDGSPSRAIAASGVLNKGVMSIYNSDIVGCMSGVDIYKDTYIDNCTIDGYMFGGIYVDEYSATSVYENIIIKNTTIKGGTYKGKYNVENFFQESKFSGMYFGKYDGTATLTAYFYNCTFDAPRAFYLRGNNSTLYMSHCKQINNTQIININNSAKLYLGVGNNFDKNATDLPSQVITTNESYNK